MQVRASKILVFVALYFSRMLTNENKIYREKIFIFFSEKFLQMKVQGYFEK